MPADAPSLSKLRLLILAPKPASLSAPSPFPPFLQSLTGTVPSSDLTTFAGYTSHPPLGLRTKYYSKDVSLWCDELPSDSPENVSEANKSDDSAESAVKLDSGLDDIGETLTLRQWQETMLSAAAGEVRSVIGGIVLILPMETPRGSTDNQVDLFMPYIQAVHALREAIEDESVGRDIASAIVLHHISPAANAVSEDSARTGDVSKTLTEKIEAKTLESDMFGWDIVWWNGQASESTTGESGQDQRNEYGEKLGMARVIEVLEGVDWSAASDFEAEVEDGPDILGDDKFKGIDHELQQEMVGLKLAMLDGDGEAADDLEGEEISVEQMNNLKSRVLAIRDTVSGMPQSQKEAFAKREIDRIMRDLE